MKLEAMEFPCWKNPTLQRTPKIVLLTTFTLILLAVISLHYPLSGIVNPILVSKVASSSSSSSSRNNEEIHEQEVVTGSESCDIFTGEWVRNPEGPYYTNATCRAIHDNQNCIKYGRPDTDFVRWRWKPDGCELAVFNPAQFLEIVQGKSLAFVGDSVARNQMQSLICLLARVEYPEDVSYAPEEKFKRWRYRTYNFTLATFWTPHLVKSKAAANTNGPTNTGLFNLYLDEFDAEWTTQIEGFDYVILSAGHWFFRPMVYYENSTIVGCKYCLLDNVTDMPMYFGYRKAFRTAFRAVNSLKNYKGITFLRTFAPSHFENGLWNAGGNCVRTLPFKNNETRLDGDNLELYMIQIEEFKIAEKEGKNRGLKFRLLDTTQAMLLRPDGHPSRFGHWPQENVTLYNDCVHWCLPGPIDVWNDFLLEMLKMEGIRSLR